MSILSRYQVCSFDTKSDVSILSMNSIKVRIHLLGSLFVVQLVESLETVPLVRVGCVDEKSIRK